MVQLLAAGDFISHLSCMHPTSNKDEIKEAEIISQQNSTKELASKRAHIDQRLFWGAKRESCN